MRRCQKQTFVDSKLEPGRDRTVAGCYPVVMHFALHHYLCNTDVGENICYALILIDVTFNIILTAACPREIKILCLR